MRRREFLGALTVSASWPVAARAQMTLGMRRIVVLIGGEDGGQWVASAAAFRDALQNLGWRDGRNIQIEFQFTGTQRERVAAHAREILASRPDVVLARPSHVVKSLMNETQTIPIVFVGVTDPIEQGIVSSLARPSGNVTGFTTIEFSVIGKWLDILKELAPSTRQVALAIGTINAAAPRWHQEFKALTPKAGLGALSTPYLDIVELERIIERLGRETGSGLILPGDTIINRPDVRRHVTALTARHRVPTIYSMVEFVRDGGLVSYGVADVHSLFGQAAAYVDRILKGERPADLPVQQPTRFRLALNFKAAAALGLSVPLPLHVSADEVIE